MHPRNTFVADEDEWACAACSFRNSGQWLACDACLRSRRVNRTSSGCGSVSLSGPVNTWAFTPRCFQLPDPPRPIGRALARSLTATPASMPFQVGIRIAEISLDRNDAYVNGAPVHSLFHPALEPPSPRIPAVRHGLGRMWLGPAQMWRRSRCRCG